MHTKRNTQTVTCPNCNAQIGAQRKQCPFCQSVVIKQPGEPVSGREPLSLIAIGALLGVIAGAATVGFIAVVRGRAALVQMAVVTQGNVNNLLLFSLLGGFTIPLILFRQHGNLRWDIETNTTFLDQLIAWALGSMAVAGCICLLAHPFAVDLRRGGMAVSASDWDIVVLPILIADAVAFFCTRMVYLFTSGDR